MPWQPAQVGLVLPEEEHIAIIRTIMTGSLIFCYSDVINETADYFNTSPIVKQIIAIANNGASPYEAALNSTKTKIQAR